MIGCGTIANGRHIPAYRELKDELEVKYCVDIIEERAISAAAHFENCKAVTDYHDILASKEVDAVTICTPNGTHESIGIDCMRAGKHVLCEKPLSVNYESCCRIRSAAQESGVICNVGLCNRFRKSIVKIRELITSGELGKIYHIYCSFRKFRSIPGLGKAYTTKAESGGGVLIDWGVHLFDVILFTCGIRNIETVSANTYNEIGKNIREYLCKEMWAGPADPNGVNDVEDFVSGFIRTDGPSISFNGAWAQNIDEENMYIEFLGSKGGIKLDYYGKYTVYTQKNGVFYTAQADYNDNDMFYSEIKAFAESIGTGEIGHNNIQNVMELHKLLDTVYRSAAAKREIVL